MWLRRIASVKLTLIAMAMLAVAAMLNYGNPLDVSVWVLVVPMALLAINLIAAIATNRRINRQPGLLMFHVGLLALVVLAAIGRLTTLDAHLEIIEGNPFEASLLLEPQIGPWHSGDLAGVYFIQGPYTVNYSPGMKRDLTYSHVLWRDPQGRMQEKVVGDDRPLVIRGYRFYTTFNKGFAPVMTWTPVGGQPITGAVNMPSFPLFDYKQDNRWTPPGTQTEIKFWLQLKTAMDRDAAWVLAKESSSGRLVVTVGDKRVELEPGESVSLATGSLRYDELRMWMGYKVFYDPTIHWMFLAAMLAIAGLGWHFWRRVANLPSLSVDQESV